VSAPLVELVGIRKAFGDLVACDDVTLDVRAGEVHALLGENGAGKSTLVRVLYGLSRPDAGVVRVEGREVAVGSPAEAIAAGLGMVTQEFSLVGPMTVAENVLLAGAPLGRLDLRAARRRLAEVADRLGWRIDPDALVADLSVGERQRVEICKALYRDCRLLILDEPTAVLTPGDAAALFTAVGRLTDQGLGVLLITHKLHEVVAAAARVSVLRRGRLTATLDLRDGPAVTPRDLAALMVGAELAAADDAAVGLTAEDVAPDEAQAAPDEGVPDEGVPGEGVPDETVAGEAPVAASTSGGRPSSEAVLEVTGVRVDGPARPVLDVERLVVRAGEIVAVAGVSGNGQTELVRVLAGVQRADAGRVVVGGADVTAADPLGRLAAGLGRITEDRKGSVVGSMSVEQNLVLEDLGRFRRGPFLDRRAVRRHAERLIAQYAIKAEPGDPVRSLSGGTMQKVLLARALDRGPRVLVASQPTRGLDVGAAAYVHERLRALAAAGAGVLVIGDDLDELLSLAHRVVVLFEGRVVGELSGARATSGRIGLLMAGGSDEGVAGAGAPDEGGAAA
jgi:simple sugar transport system ATP-binding protein